MADDPTTLDYLGASAPLTLTDKASLPVGGPPAGGVGPIPSVGGKSAVGTAGPTTTITQPNAVTTGPSGAPGIPGEPAPAGAAQGAAPPLDLQAILSQGGNLADTLRKFFGSDFGSTGLGADVPTDDQGRSIFGNAETGFTLLDKFRGVKDLDVKFDDQGRLVLGNPELGFTTLDAFRGVPGFQDVLAGADPSAGGADIPSFGAGSFSGGEAAAFGLAPETGSGGGGLGNAASLALPLAQLGFSLMQGGEQNIGGALVKAAINFTPQAAGLLAGVPFDQIGSMTFNPVLSAWNLPQIASTIQNLVDPLTEQAMRRSGRNRDASDLQREIFQPLTTAKTPEEFISALATPVGGSTVGDALARALKDNESGGWAGLEGKAFPDLGLIPLKNALNQLGYMGETQPTRGDVGGVGEIIAGAGSQMIPYEVQRYFSEFQSPSATEGGAQRATASPEVQKWIDEHMPGYGTVGARATTPGGGWAGWDSALTDLSRALGLDTSAPRAEAPNPTAEFMSGAEGGGQWSEPAAAAMANPAYLDALAASNPEAAEAVKQALLEQEQRWADAASYQSA